MTPFVNSAPLSPGRRWTLCLAGVVTCVCAVLGGSGAARAAGTPEPSGTVVPLVAARLAPAGMPALRGSASAAAVGPGREFNLVGALVRGVGPSRLGVIVRLRTSLDRQTWSEWLVLEFPVAGRPEGSVFGGRDSVSEPVWIGRARYAQIDFDGPRAAVAALRASLRVACVTSPWEDTGGAARSGPSAGVGEAGSLTARQPGKPEIVTRRQWGANESWRKDDPEYGRVQMVFIHHTVSSNGYTRAQAPAIVRSVYYYHTQVNGWDDIGYNFLVDRYGTVYEGRYGGVTRSVVGAQTLGFNTYSTGVSVIGTYTSAKPPAAAMAALERLIAWKLDVHHVDPRGYVTVRCLDSEKFPEGALVRFSAISGHRQANYTTCPGNGIFNRIAAIRRAVDAIGQPKIYAPAASPPAFSPNGDGERDVSEAVCTVSQTADWRVDVRNDLGETVRTFGGRGDAVAAEWDGRDQQGAALPDGRYTYLISALNEAGTARPAEVGVRIDVGAPPVNRVYASPSTVSPDGDGVADTTLVYFTVAEICRARVSLFDVGGALVRRLRDGWSFVPAGVNAVPWDGTLTVDGERVAAPDGVYRVLVEAMDAAGSRGTGAGTLLVDSTLGFVKAAPTYLSPNGDGVQDTSDLGFRLAVGATVSVSLVHGDAVLREWALGELGKGSHAIAWNGADRSGATVSSGRYAFVVTAENEVGTVTVRAPVRVDRSRPRPATTVAAATVRAGRTFTLKYTVDDRYSSKVRVRIVVTDSAGAVVRSTLVGWIASGRARTWSYVTAARGVYTVAVTATDKAGNRQAAPAEVALTVR